MAGGLIRFALNHMAAPQLDLPAFFALATQLGIGDVEIRNDIAGQAILDGTDATTVKSRAADSGLSILTINALQRFNDWSAERAREADELIRFCAASGAKALILVPKNDGTDREVDVRQRKLRESLKALAPMLKDAGVLGLVEPLGFAECSLRFKREAGDAIRDIGGPFLITHDTFHHYVAGETGLVPDLTGLVHISGVSAPGVAISEMRDSHRVLVDSRDRIDNVGQILALRRAGYAGPFSFEPFAEELRRVANPAAGLRESMDYIAAELSRAG